MGARLGRVWLSLASALAAACCFGVASVIRALAARAASRGSARVSPGLLVRMLGQWRFVASLVLDLVSFVAQLVALRRLPLFVVQAAIASALAVTAVLSAWLAKHALAAREGLAVIAGTIGIAMPGSPAGAPRAAGGGGQVRLGPLPPRGGRRRAALPPPRAPRPA